MGLDSWNAGLRLSERTRSLRPDGTVARAFPFVPAVFESGVSPPPPPLQSIMFS